MAHGQDLCLRSLRVGDAVHVFTQTHDKWVAAEVVHFVGHHQVRVEFVLDGARCGKTLHVHSAQLATATDAPGPVRRGGPRPNPAAQQLERKSALIIVDVQNDFISGTLANPYNAEEIVPVINGIRDSFDVVVISCDWHPMDHCSFVEAANAGKVYDKGRPPRAGYKAFSSITLLADADRPEHQQTLYPRHAVQGTEGAACHKDLVLKDSDLRVYKGTKQNIDSYSAFFDNMKFNDTGLTAMLRRERVTDVYCCGLVTDICVKSTALHGAEGGFNVVVIEDASKPLSMDNMEETRRQLANGNVAIMTAQEAVKAAERAKKDPMLPFAVAGRIYAAVAPGCSRPPGAGA